MRKAKSPDEAAADLYRLRKARQRLADQGVKVAAVVETEEQRELKESHGREEWLVTTVYLFDPDRPPAILTYGPYVMTDAIAVQTMLTVLHMRAIDDLTKVPIAYDDGRHGVAADDCRFHATIGRAMKLTYSPGTLERGLEDKVHPIAGLRRARHHNGTGARKLDEYPPGHKAAPIRDGPQSLEM